MRPQLVRHERRSDTTSECRLSSTYLLSILSACHKYEHDRRLAFFLELLVVGLGAAAILSNCCANGLKPNLPSPTECPRNDSAVAMVRFARREGASLKVPSRPRRRRRAAFPSVQWRQLNSPSLTQGGISHPSTAFRYHCIAFARRRSLIQSWVVLLQAGGSASSFRRTLPWNQFHDEKALGPAN
jgi:hypothetical protein